MYPNIEVMCIVKFQFVLKVLLVKTRNKVEE